MTDKDEKKKPAAHGPDPHARDAPVKDGPTKPDGAKVPAPGAPSKPEPGAAKELPGEWKGAQPAWKPAAMAPKPPAPAGVGWKSVSTSPPAPEKAAAWQPLSQSTVGAAIATPDPHSEKAHDDKKAKKDANTGPKKDAESGPKPDAAPKPEAQIPGGSTRIHQPGEVSKTDLRLTQQTDKEKFRSALDQKAFRAGVIKTPDWETPKATLPTPVTPPATGAWTTAPASPAAPGLAPPQWKPAEPPKAAEAPKPAGVESVSAGLRLPQARPIPAELMGADTSVPLTADDVLIDYYPIQEPYAYVMVTYNNRDKEMLYRALEPILTPEEQRVLDFLRQTMVDLLDAPPDELRKKTPKEFLKARFEEILYDYSVVLGDNEAQEAASKDRLLYYVYRDFIGEARIDVLSRDDLIEDISCDGPHQPVFIYHRKYESLKSNVKFRDDDELDSFVIRMAQRAGKHVSIAEPILDATMRDGSRLQATLAHEVSSFGSTFTIRKFRTEPFTPPDLVRFGTQSAELLAYWWIAIQHGASAIYAGGTASGKTTSLNAILLFIPYQMKIVSIEDTRELSIPHPNWIAGITRSGFGARDREGRQAGEIDMFQLLKNALRQRPEYIIVGEVRGKEAYNLFQAMATGHAAYGTMHADSVDAVIHRLESDPINIPRSLLEALDIISIQIQTRVGGKRVRRTKQLAEIVGLDPHTREILTNEVFRWSPKDDSFKFSGVSYVLERIQVEKGMTPQQMKEEIENRVEVIKYLIRHNIRNYKDCARVIAAYYKDAAATMQKIREDTPWT